MDWKGEKSGEFSKVKQTPVVDSAKEVMQVSGLLLREIHPHARRGLHVCKGER